MTTDTNPAALLIGSQEAWRLLGISTRTLYSLTKAGKLSSASSRQSGRFDHACRRLAGVHRPAARLHARRPAVTSPISDPVSMASGEEMKCSKLLAEHRRLLIRRCSEPC